MQRLFPQLVITAIGLSLLVIGAFGQEATAEPTPESGPQVLTVWWPDLLLPNTDAALNDLVEQQRINFMDSRENTEVVIRRRLVGQTGGIMSTLRTGSTIAPSALPDITLLRRPDLVTAQQLGLIQSLEGRIMSAMTSDLDQALQLGQIESELYGLPYVLDLSHVIYRPQAELEYDRWDFEALLERNESFTFPGAAQNRLNNTMLLQYLAAGGVLNADGTLVFDEAVLEDLLSFYEQASDAQIIDGFALNYTAPSDYLNLLLDESLQAGVFTSTTYLQQVESDLALRVAPIPTISGEAVASLEGWVWVVVNDDPDVQDLALDYIAWMMQPQQLGDFSQAAKRLPALRSVQDMMALPEVTLSQYRQLLDGAVLLPVNSAGTSVGRTIQDALISVLSSQLTTEEALERVTTQLGQ